MLAKGSPAGKKYWLCSTAPVTFNFNNISISMNDMHFTNIFMYIETIQHIKVPGLGLPHARYE